MDTGLVIGLIIVGIPLGLFGLMILSVVWLSD